MPLTKQRKTEIIDALAQKITKSKTIIFTHFAKIPVEKLKGLRRELRIKNAEYRVVKKTLFRVAAEKAGATISDINLKQVPDAMGIVFGTADQVHPARTVYQFSRTKEQEGFKVLGGMFDTSFVGADKIAALAKFASREDLLARLLGQMKAPFSRLAYVLKSVADKK